MRADQQIPAAQAQAPRKWLVLVAVGTGTFMSALDGSVVNAILPVVRDRLRADVATVEWVVTVYLLVVSGLLLGFGRLGDARGHRTVYLWGVAGFVASSALCGLSPSAEWLIGFRAWQAISASMQFANSPAILTKTFPPHQRGQALGLQATMTYLGLTVGPSLGGFLAEHWSWRAVFYINVPVGAVAFFLSARYVIPDAPEHVEQGFDWAGAATFFAGLLALLLGLNQGHAWGWSSPVILGLLFASAVLLALFLRIERRVPRPMLDLTLFARPAFAGATASAVINYVCVYGILFLVPFYLIEGRSLSPARAGLLLTAQPLVMMFVAPLAGTLSDRIGTRIPAMAGMATLALGLFLLSRLDAGTPLGRVAADLAVCGLGTGIFIAPNNSGLMGAAPRDRQGIAAGVLATARNAGMVLGVGLAGAILTTVLHGGGEGALFRAIQVGFAVTATLAASAGVATAAIGGGRGRSHGEDKSEEASRRSWS
jgi:EmrB/QacA subfamily drug resistance transporter